jgi:hypothetical protein
MNPEQELIYLNKSYRILCMEQDFLVHPAALGLLPLTKASLQCLFSTAFHVEDYQLFLDTLTIHNTEPVAGLGSDGSENQSFFENCRVSYNGAVLIGTNIGKEYYMKADKPACFSYQTVIELVFEDGSLITAVDQSKAMLRIRKNLELGLRSLSVKRDIGCIRRFMNSAFVGDSHAFRFPNSHMRYLREMKKEYTDKNPVIR